MGKMLRFNNNIREKHIFHIPRIPHLDADSAMAAINNAVIDHNIAEIPEAARP
jgi:hypothetical protein